MLARDNRCVLRMVSRPEAGSWCLIQLMLPVSLQCVWPVGSREVLGVSGLLLLIVCGSCRQLLRRGADCSPLPCSYPVLSVMSGQLTLTSKGLTRDTLSQVSESEADSWTERKQEAVKVWCSIVHLVAVRLAGFCEVRWKIPSVQARKPSTASHGCSRAPSCSRASDHLRAGMRLPL